MTMNSTMLALLVNFFWVVTCIATVLIVYASQQLLERNHFHPAIQFVSTGFLSTELMYWLPNAGVHYIFGAKLLMPYVITPKEGHKDVPYDVKMWKTPYQMRAMAEARLSRIQGYWLDPLLYAFIWVGSGGMITSSLDLTSLISTDIMGWCKSAAIQFILLSSFDFGTFLLHWIMHTPTFYLKVHKVHHNVRHLSPWVNDVEHVVESTCNVLLKCFTIIAAARCGAFQSNPWGVSFFFAFTKWYGVMEHLNMTLPPLNLLHAYRESNYPLSSLITTPAYHDEHHRYMDDIGAAGKLAVYTTLWDRLFEKQIRASTVKLHYSKVSKR